MLSLNSTFESRCENRGVCFGSDRTDLRNGLNLDCNTLRQSESCPTPSRLIQTIDTISYIISKRLKLKQQWLA